MGLQNHLSSDISANLLVASIAEELTTTIKGIEIDKKDRNKLLNKMLEINKILEESKSQDKVFSFKSQLQEIQDILNEPIHKSWMEKILFKTHNLISYMNGSGKEEKAEQGKKDDEDMIRQCFNEWNQMFTSAPDNVKENQPMPHDSFKVIHEIPDNHWENNNSFVSESEILIVNYSHIRHEKSRDNVSEETESHKSNIYDIGSFDTEHNLTNSSRPIYSLETETEQTDELSCLDQALLEKICVTGAMKEMNRSKRPKDRVCTRQGSRNKSKNEEPAKRTNSPAKETHKLADCPAKETAKRADSPAKETHKLADSPAKETAKRADSPAKETHKLADSPAKETGKLADSPAKEIAKLADSPAKETHKLADCPAKEIAKLADSPAKETAKRADSPAKETAKRADSPAKETAKRADSPAKETAKLADSPAKETAKRADSPAKETAKRADSPSKETAKRADSPAKGTAKRAYSPPKLNEDLLHNKGVIIEGYETFKAFYESQRTDLPETNDKDETSRELQEIIEISNENDSYNSTNPVPKVGKVEPKRKKTKEKRERKCNVSGNRHKTNVKPEDSTLSTVYSVLIQSKKFNTRKKLNRLGNCGISFNVKSTEEECQCGLKTGVASIDMTNDKHLRDAALLPTPVPPDSSGSMFRYLGEMCYQKLLPGAAFSPSQVKNMLTMCEEKKPEVKEQLSRTRVILKEQVQKKGNIGDRKSTKRRKRSNRYKQIDPAVVEDLKSRCVSIRKQLEWIESKVDLLNTKSRPRKRVGDSESGNEVEDFRRMRGGQRRTTPPENVQGSYLCNIL